jgi:hypothetical protein
LSQAFLDGPFQNRVPIWSTRTVAQIRVPRRPVVVVVVVVFAGCRRRATTRGDASWRPSAAMVIVLRVRGRARASNTVSAVVSCAAAWRSREGVVAPASTRHRSETAPESSRRVVADRDRRKALQER